MPWMQTKGSQPKSNIIKIELHHGSRKSVATLRTVRTLIVRCLRTCIVGEMGYWWDKG
jgi:hypothetical protein